jgi:predicted metal-dependent hydrolase
MNTTMAISGLVFEIRRGQRRKTLGLTVDRAGELVVHAPLDTSEAEVRQWVSGKLLWVHRKLAQKHALARNVHPPEFVSGESIFYLGRSYRLRIVDKARKPLQVDGEWFELRRGAVSTAADHFQQWYIDEGAAWLRTRSADLERLSGQTASEVIVCDLGFRWGSCGKSGTLYFNWRLLQLPVRIIDYVILHEQMHRLHYDHSTRFWKAMDRVLPDWEERKQECEREWGRYARFALTTSLAAGT